MGNSNVIESAGILGIQRIVCVTSIGCGSSREVAPLAVSEVLKGALEAKEKAENLLQKYYTNSNWTIIRPGGLQTKPMTGKAILTEDHTAIGSIHRQDLAALLVQALHSPIQKEKFCRLLILPLRVPLWHPRDDNMFHFPCKADRIREVGNKKKKALARDSKTVQNSNSNFFRISCF